MRKLGDAWVPSAARTMGGMLSFPRSAALVPELLVRESSASTNDELVALAGGLPDFATLVTANQTAGKGRLGRTWVAPAGSALAISVLVRPRVPGGEPLEVDRYGWLPLAAGLAMADAVAASGVRGAAVKWPNDVLIRERKVCGVLAELIPGGVVIGAGVNTAMTADELPVPTATSLAVENAWNGDHDALVAGYLSSLRALVADYLRAGGDADASGLHERVTEACDTLGRMVRVDLPDGTQRVGLAASIDRSGRLVVRDRSDGKEFPVAAGDVVHVRSVDDGA